MKVSTILVAVGLLCLLRPTLLCAQKMYYIDQNQKSVSVSEFNQSVLKNKVGWGYDKTDTATFVRLSLSYAQGKLPISYVSQIRKLLETYSTSKIDTNSLLIVSYYTGIEHKIRKGYPLMTKDDHHLKAHDQFLKKLGNIRYFNIYDKKLHPDSVYKAFYHNFRDSEGFFAKFFDLQYPLINDIIIRPDGRYLIAYGITVNEINRYKIIKEMLKPNYIGVE